MTLYKRLDSLSVFLFCKPRCQDYLGRKVGFVITDFNSPPEFYPICSRYIWNIALANGAIPFPIFYDGNDMSQIKVLHFSNQKLYKYCIFPPRFRSIFALFQLFAGSNIQVERAAEGGNCLFINSPKSKVQSLQCLLFRADLTF